MKKLVIFVLILLAADQVTKFIVERNIGLHEEIAVIDNFFWLNHVHNTGMAFGIGNGAKYSNLKFSAIAIFALAIIYFFFIKDKQIFRQNFIGIVLLIAGILGNFTDRIFRGYVVDFLHFNLGFMDWPSFNIADSCITCGAIYFIITSFSHKGEPKLSKN